MQHLKGINPLNISPIVVNFVSKKLQCSVLAISTQALSLEKLPSVVRYRVCITEGFICESGFSSQNYN